MTNDMVKVPQQGEVQRQLSPQDIKLGKTRELLARHMKALTSALPAHMKPERLARIVLTTVQKNPKLMDCTPESFLGCVLSCAALGLEPDGLLGQAYLVPFKDHGRMICTLIPGYKGLMKLAYQSGEIASIDAHEVRIGDDFSYSYGTKPTLMHKPAEAPIIEKDGVKMIDENWRPGAITHFYAVAIMLNGTTQFRVMPTWQVNEIRNGSQGYRYAVSNSGDNPWISDYAEMGKKTAIRALAKLLPASVDKAAPLQRAVSIDERADRGLSQDLDLITDIPALPQPQDAEIVGDASDGNGAPKGDGKETLADVAAKSKAGRVHVEGPDGKAVE